MPFTEIALDNAVGVVCHADGALADLRRRSPAPAFCLPLPFDTQPPDCLPGRAWEPPFRLVMFGYVGTNRRLLEVLDTLAGMPERALFRLDVYGTLWDEGAVRACVSRLGLEGMATIHGFVTEDDLNAAIAAAHLAFNLRHPTLGEASGGVLRAWRFATPALVTDAGWYAGLPDEVAVKIGVETEAADIRAALRRLMADPAAFAAMGAAASAYLADRHRPSDYVSGLMAVVNDFPAMAARLAARKSLEAAIQRTGAMVRRSILTTRLPDHLARLYAADV
jgi:glycosyltransferase involved in cell wall biosynthesis